MNAYSPTVCPQTIVALAPIVAPRLTKVGRNSSFRSTSARGLLTLVKTQDGPQNTPSSSVTPLYSDTLFWILQPSPTVTSGPTMTFWPNEQSRPIRVRGRICAKCQMRVPAPISQGSSTKAD